MNAIQPLSWTWLKSKEWFALIFAFQTHKSVPIYGPTHNTVHIWSCIVTTWASRWNVSRRCFERLVSVSSRYRQSNVSVSRLWRLGLVSVSASYVSFTTLTHSIYSYINKHAKRKVALYKVQQWVNLFHVVKPSEERVVKTGADVLTKPLQLVNSHSGVHTEIHINNILELPWSHVAWRQTSRCTYVIRSTCELTPIDHKVDSFTTNITFSLIRYRSCPQWPGPQTAQPSFDHSMHDDEN